MHFGLKQGEGCGRGNRFFFSLHSQKIKENCGLMLQDTTLLVSGELSWLSHNIFLFVLLDRLSSLMTLHKSLLEK